MARESLRLRAQQSVSARTMVVVAAIVAAICFGFSTPAWRVLAWMLPVVLMAQINAVLSARALAMLETADAAALAEQQTDHWWITVANQALMGTTVWWIGYGTSGGIATFATVLQLIYLGGALVNASTHPATFIAGAWINLAFAAVFWLTQGGTNGLPLALALFGVGLVVAVSSRQTAQAFRDSLQIRFENADLLRRLGEEKQVAEEANAAKSRFLAAASHDLRQPLHALLVFSSLLHRHETPQTAQLIAHIRDAAGSLDKLFSGLLDLSKLETGSIVPQMQALNIAAMVKDLAREFEPRCAAKGVSIVAEGDDEAWVLSDAFLLERILRNLVDNAVKYTNDGGVMVSVLAKESVVELQVRDTGIGIALDSQARVFEEYFQVGNPSRDPGQGSGLGLAIVRRLATLLGLEMGMQSNPGQGTTFMLTLPQAPIFESTGAGALSAPAQPVVLGMAVDVWLVEDHALVRMATTQALESWGCKVTQWDGMPPDSAIDAAAAPPHALVADYRLSGEATGLDVAQRLRTRWPALPVAIITGDPGIDVHEVARLGNIAMWQKPVLPSLLINWLAEIGEPVADRRAPALGPLADRPGTVSPS
ncbi:signal transduction histidine kinase [Acidovorax sp. CF316]|uniref:ATP-binding response regulator n=1 Tax=Acidovorax sp. CF316 TaxID=1144317 RepID=UPI00026BC28D|nr:hybrid sensor histidine kinase/response regulator [Acidovorax sp. CF316]EJE54090.1 signal transduction histidine kinase [Acidovorax sp. CF316]